MAQHQPDPTLRVIDFGRVSALRSQTLWHAIAYGVSAGAPPTLAFSRPSRPYVSIGFHRRLAEVDQAACRRRGLCVYRRMVGGGPVYLDDGQLFFQIVLPVSAVPPARAAALRWLLGPAVEAFRTAGVPAELDDAGEIVVDDRKVCGHGAGQIDEAVVVVGNLIERFDHEAAADVLRAPSAAAHDETVRLMRRYVAPTQADPAQFKAAAVDAYAGLLGTSARPGVLTERERGWLAKLDRRFRDSSWIAGRPRPEPHAWQAKIRAGVWVLAAEHAGTGIVASIVNDRIERVRLDDATLNGERAAVERALQGTSLADAGSRLRPFGAPGQRVLAALAKGDGSRL